MFPVKIVATFLAAPTSIGYAVVERSHQAVCGDQIIVAKAHGEESSLVSRIDATVARPMYVPKTEMAKKLLAIRNKAIAHGLKLRAAAEIIAEVRAARAE